MTDAIARETQAPVARVFAPAEAHRGGVGLQLRARERQKRAHDDATADGYARQPGEAGAAGEAEQDRLRLVIGVMSGHHRIRTHALGSGEQDMFVEYRDKIDCRDLPYADDSVDWTDGWQGKAQLESFADAQS